LYQYSPVSAFPQVPGFFVRREALRIGLVMRWPCAGCALTVRWSYGGRAAVTPRLQVNPSS
jgi:hypothetical protein